MNCSTAFGDHLFWSRFRCEELYGSRKSTAKMWHESLLPFKMSQDFDALGFSWNHPSKFTWEFCAKIHDLTPPSKQIVPKSDLHFLWATIVGKVVLFHKKSNLYPTNKKKWKWLSISALHLVVFIIFPSKNKNETGKSWEIPVGTRSYTLAMWMWS